MSISLRLFTEAFELFWQKTAFCWHALILRALAVQFGGVPTIAKTCGRQAGNQNFKSLLETHLPVPYFKITAKGLLKSVLNLMAFD